MPRFLVADTSKAQERQSTDMSNGEFWYHVAQSSAQQSAETTAIPVCSNMEHTGGSSQCLHGVADIVGGGLTEGSSHLKNGQMAFSFLLPSQVLEKV